MKLVRDDDRDPRDDELHAALRAEYAPPSGESYWALLERRIMARISADGAREWWSYFPAWSRIGLAAAALALAVAGAAAWQTRRAQERVAYRQLLDTPAEFPILTETGTDGPSAKTREATLRYLISR